MMNEKWNLTNNLRNFKPNPLPTELPVHDRHHKTRNQVRSFYIVNNSLRIELCFFRIQEMILDDQREAGRIPRNIECELTCGLGNINNYLLAAMKPLE